MASPLMNPMMMQGLRPTQPYPTSGASNIATGIASFLTQFQAAQEVEKEKNWQDFQRDMQLIQLGIPVDYKMVEKHAKRAGVPLDTSGPTKQQLDQKVQAKQAQEQGAGLLTRMAQGVQIPNLQFAPPIAGGQQPPPVAAGPAQQGAPAPMQLPQQPPNAFHQWLGGQENLAQQRLSAQAMTEKLNMTKLNVAVAALSENPDPRATEMAMRLGIFKELPWDAQQWLFKAAGIGDQEGAQRTLWAATGGPQTQGQYLDYLKHLNTMEKDKRDDAIKMAVEIKKERPYAPWSLAFANSVAYLNKDLKTFAETRRIIEQSPSTAEVEKGPSKFAQGAAQRAEARAERGVRATERQAATAEGQLGLAGQRFEWDQFEGAWSRFFNMATNKETPDTAKSEAWKVLSDTAQKAGIPLTTEETKWWQRWLPFTGVGAGEKVQVKYGSEGAAAKSKTLGNTPPATGVPQDWFGGVGSWMNQRGTAPSEAPPPELPGGQAASKGSVGIPQLLAMTAGTRMTLKEAVEMAESMGYSVPAEVRNAVLLSTLYGNPIMQPQGQAQQQPPGSVPLNINRGFPQPSQFRVGR